MNKVICLSGLIISFILLSGCINNVNRYEFVCSGILEEVFVDGTMASIQLSNGTCKGITFYPHKNENYDCFTFELLEIGREYTFVFHYEDNVARPGIDMFYIDDAPVIDMINNGNHVDYWVNERGSEIW